MRLALASVISPKQPHFLYLFHCSFFSFVLAHVLSVMCVLCRIILFVAQTCWCRRVDLLWLTGDPSPVVRCSICCCVSGPFFLLLNGFFPTTPCCCIFSFGYEPRYIQSHRYRSSAFL